MANERHAGNGSVRSQKSRELSSNFAESDESNFRSCSSSASLGGFLRNSSLNDASTPCGEWFKAFKELIQSKRVAFVVAQRLIHWFRFHVWHFHWNRNGTHRQGISCRSGRNTLALLTPLPLLPELCRWRFSGIGEASLRIRFRPLVALSCPMWRHSSLMVAPSTVTTRKSGSLELFCFLRLRIASAKICDGVFSSGKPAKLQDSFSKEYMFLLNFSTRYLEVNKYRFFQSL